MFYKNVFEYSGYSFLTSKRENHTKTGKYPSQQPKTDNNPKKCGIGIPKIARNSGSRSCNVHLSRTDELETLDCPEQAA